MKIPERIRLANLPTPIQQLNAFDLPMKLFIKRDDFTGIELSGNKIRKLEFVLKDVLDKQCNVLITCGGVQSNHCRATASAAASLGLKSHLVLRGTAQSPDGNYLMDQMFGADFSFITAEQYKNNRGEIMQEVYDEYTAKGFKPYIIPEGATFGIGLFGYYNAYEEILEQEKELGVTFDTICITEGSGGTYAGLFLANELYGGKKRIVGFNIYDATVDSAALVRQLCSEAMKISGYSGELDYGHVFSIMEYAGAGYGIASDEVRAFIRSFARQTGILLDPVYTGKAMHGLFEEIKKGNPVLQGNILFIHTGGLFGLFPQKDQF